MRGNSTGFLGGGFARTGVWRPFAIWCFLLFLTGVIMPWSEIYGQGAGSNSGEALRIRGVVLDTADPPAPLIGVSVIIKGTQKGVTTDTEGFFSIEAARGQTLLFSYMGYKDKEYAVTRNEASLTIALAEDNTALEEVVVLGMSSQQKTNIASSVGTIETSNFVGKPITQLSQALQGGTTGILVSQSSGLPGGDAATIKIRGVASLLGSDPLVLVDGMEFDMNKLDPATVESISVLKDAAAASMYGSRAANGVILITTKRGSAGQVSVTYNGYGGVQTPVYRPDFVDAPTYMEMVVNAQNNVGAAPSYTAEDIQKARDGSDPINFPDTNWADLVLRRISPITEHAISASGGNSIARFALSAQYLNQGALIKHDKAGFQRLTVRGNTSVNLTKKFTVYLDFFVGRDDQKESGVTTGSILDWMNRANPTIVGRYPAKEGYDYPLYGDFEQTRNPLANLEQGGYKQNLKDETLVNLRPMWVINENFTLKGQVGYRLSSRASIANRETFPLTNYFTDETTNYITAIKTPSIPQRSTYYIAMGELHYDKGFGRHNVSAVAGYSQELETVVQDETGGTRKWDDMAIMSAYAKAYYRFRDRYLAEVGIRADGSSIFGPGQKWGYFPSVAVGWNVDKESFMRSLGFVNQFKIRASYGLLGNNNIGPYKYQATISNGNGAETTNANPYITWEKTRILDVGADISLFDQKFDITFDWFVKNVNDLIITVKSSMSSGLLSTPMNVGEAEVRGFELGFGYNHSFSKDMRLSVNVGYSYNKSKWLKMVDEEIISGNTIHKLGSAISEHYGYLTDGLLTQDDIDNRVPVWGGYDSYGDPVGQAVGDIKYIDKNDDGQITDADRVPLGAKDPKSTFYLNLSYKYKNFDFETLLSGVGKVPVFYTTKIATPLNISSDGGTPQSWHLDYWTPENPDARFPRLTPSPGNNSLYSDFWEENGAFVRVRYIQLGYSFKKFAEKIGIGNIRLYLNAQNPFTFTGLKMLDPETKGSYTTHPIFKVYSIGVNINF